MIEPTTLDHQRQMAEVLRQEKDPTPLSTLKTHERERKQAQPKIVPTSNSPQASLYIYSESNLKNALPAGEDLRLSNTESTAYKSSNSYNSHPSEHNFLLDS